MARAFEASASDSDGLEKDDKVVLVEGKDLIVEADGMQPQVLENEFLLDWETKRKENLKKNWPTKDPINDGLDERARKRARVPTNESVGGTSHVNTNQPRERHYQTAIGLAGKTAAESLAMFKRVVHELDAQCTEGYQAILNGFPGGQNGMSRSVRNRGSRGMSAAAFKAAKANATDDRSHDPLDELDFYDQLIGRAVVDPCADKIRTSRCNCGSCHARRREERGRVQAELQAAKDALGPPQFAYMREDAEKMNPPGLISIMHKNQVLEYEALNKAKTKEAMEKRNADFDRAGKDADTTFNEKDDVDLALKQIAKGVKKMTKGLDDEKS